MRKFLMLFLLTATTVLAGCSSNQKVSDIAKDTSTINEDVANEAINKQEAGDSEETSGNTNDVNTNKQTLRSLGYDKVEFINSSNDGVAVVFTDNEQNNTFKYGLVDNDFNIAITPNIAEFNDGLSVSVTADLKFGYINTKGEWVIEPVYESASRFDGGIAVVETKDPNALYEDEVDKTVVIDKTGKVLFELPDYYYKQVGGGIIYCDDRIYHADGTSYDVVDLSDYNINYYGEYAAHRDYIIDKEGNVVFSSDDLSVVGNVNNNKFLVTDTEDNLIYMSLDGEKYFEIPRDEHFNIHGFYNGLAAITKLVDGVEKLGFINENGDLVIDYQYSPDNLGFTDFNKNYNFVKIFRANDEGKDSGEGYYILIDNEGNTIIDESEKIKSVQTNISGDLYPGNLTVVNKITDITNSTSEKFIINKKTGNTIKLSDLLDIPLAE